MGVQTVVLSNVLKSDDITASGDGVENGNIIDYKAIDEKIGTLEDFKSLISKMKEKGIVMFYFLEKNLLNSNLEFLISIPTFFFYVFLFDIFFNYDNGAFFSQFSF